MKKFQVVSTQTVRTVWDVLADNLEEAKTKVLEGRVYKPLAWYYLDDFSIDEEDCMELPIK